MRRGSLAEKGVHAVRSGEERGWQVREPGNFVSCAVRLYVSVGVCLSSRTRVSWVGSQRVCQWITLTLAEAASPSVNRQVGRLWIQTDHSGAAAPRRSVLEAGASSGCEGEDFSKPGREEPWGKQNLENYHYSDVENEGKEGGRIPRCHVGHLLGFIALGNMVSQMYSILCSQRWRSSIQSAKPRPGTDWLWLRSWTSYCLKFRLKLKKVGKTTSSFKYDLNQTPYDYTVEVTNRFKGLDMVDRVPEELWKEVSNIIQEAVTKTIPK